MTYDFNTGLPLTVTDDFGQTVATEYNDPLLRPTRTYGVNFTAPESQTIYGDTPGNLFVKVRKQLDATNWDEATTFMDGLGRAVKTLAKDSQGDVFVEMEYDNMSRVKRVTNPYRQGDAKLWTTTDYDELGRMKFITTPDTARVETQYGLSTTGTEIGTTTTVIDQALKQRRSVTNALEQLIRVDEPNLNNELGSINGPYQATRYFYNALGKMTRVQQDIQNRYFMYDSLGRMIRVKQPEQEVNIALNTTGNPDNNSWSAGFTYDVLGNVLTSTDAKGTVITNTYDRANRVTTRTYSNEPAGVTTPAVSYFYDGKGLAQQQTPNFAKGKLTKVTSSVSTTEYMTFDNFGRLTRSRQITDGVVYGDDAHAMTYSYNLSGALIEQKYPSGRVVKNEFESDGDIARISGKPTSTATEQMYATGFQYFADGKIERLKLGNGLWESAKLNNRMQATEIAMGHSVGDGSLMKLSYEYGELSANGASVITSKNAGNIARQTVSFSGLTHPFVQTYRYDSLHRIAEAIEKVNDNQTWKQTFGYDIYGNRNAFYQKVGEQELVINNLTAPTVDQNTNRFNANQGYGYDKNGNITTDPANSGRSFVFNGDNKQTQVKNSSEVTIGTYLYDGDGKRVKKVTNLETTVFVYDGLGKLVAEYSTATPPTNPTINYTATDKLGSPRVITDKLGNVVSRRDFLPFGEEIYANSSANRFSSGQGYGYDQNGNVTQDAEGKRFGYDAENHQKEFFAVGNSSSTPDATYSYDGDGRRVKKISSTETTVFVYNASGQLVAEYSTQIAQTPQVSYLTTDHLGSPRVITDQLGVVKDRKDFSAFGEESVSAQRSNNTEYTAADQLRKNYTGYEKDSESGLEFAQARYYNPKHGRFTSVDPLTASANVKNPQTFNRYSYVLNSPYKFVDPLGLLSVETGACGQWCPGSDGGMGDGAFGAALNGGFGAGGITVGLWDELTPEQQRLFSTFFAGQKSTMASLLRFFFGNGAAGAYWNLSAAAHNTGVLLPSLRLLDQSQLTAFIGVTSMWEKAKRKDGKTGVSQLVSAVTEIEADDGKDKGFRLRGTLVEGGGDVLDEVWDHERGLSKSDGTYTYSISRREPGRDAPRGQFTLTKDQKRFDSDVDYHTSADFGYHLQHDNSDIMREGIRTWFPYPHKHRHLTDHVKAYGRIPITIKK